MLLCLTSLGAPTTSSSSHAHSLSTPPCRSLFAFGFLPPGVLVLPHAHVVVAKLVSSLETAREGARTGS